MFERPKSNGHGGGGVGFKPKKATHIWPYLEPILENMDGLNPFAASVMRWLGKIACAGKPCGGTYDPIQLPLITQKQKLYL